jgi:alkanesulfonate monooxygenase SsuD/methylene tetrahydromethanopterin reductase-like flavin-dependent oxidoreductase (luciferase family)
MSNVRAGLFFHPTGTGTAAEVYENTLLLIQEAEAAGFHAAWVSQLHFQSFRGRLSSPFPFLVRAADRTRNIDLASGVVTLPFENPLRLAEDAAVTNVLLRERLSFGVGSGEPVAAEFEPFGVPFEEKSERSRKNLGALLKALRGEPLGPHGVKLQPPAGRLAERVWWATGNRERAIWAAQEGVNLLINVDQTRWDVPMAQANAETAHHFRTAWTHGHSPRIGAWRIVFPWDGPDALDAYWHITSAEAQVNLKRGLTKGAGTLEELRARHQTTQLLVIGSSKKIVEQLRREEEEIGFTDFQFYFTFSGLDHAAKVRLLHRLADEVAGPLGWLRTGVGTERTLQLHPPQSRARLAGVRTAAERDHDQ